MYNAIVYQYNINIIWSSTSFL